MPQPTMPADGSEAVDLFWDPITHPLRSVSLYYSLYYLVEVEGVEEARFDFHHIEDELHDAFFWYGIYAIGREVSHVPNGASFPYKDTEEPGEEVVQYDALSIDDDLSWADFDWDDVLEQVFEWSAYTEEIKTLIQNADGARRVIRQYNQAPAVKLLNYYEAKGVNPVSEPFEFIGVCMDFFNDYDFGHNWAMNYGSLPWNKIADHLSTIPVQSKTMWVDTSWAIQHNNDVWLDKVLFAQEEMEPARELLRERFGDSYSTDPQEQVTSALGILLDDNQAGDMEPLFEMAAPYTHELTFNLSRWHRTLF